jgi:DNA-binding transcriptional LysR family regulator
MLAMPSIPSLPEASRRPALHFPGLLAFARVARHRSFARAASELDVTPTAISKTIKQLEAQLGVRLFHRTTRSVSLTESGQRLQASLVPALEQIQSSVEQVADSAQRPQGALRINVSFVAYATLIEPHLSAFLERYPEISLEVSVDNILRNIVSEGFDAGFRLGHALQRDMIALPLGPTQQRVVVAAPEYLKRHPSPARPQDLLKHDCIRQRLSSGGRFFEWTFKVQHKPLTIEVRGRLIFDEMRAALAAVRQGCGLGYVFAPFAAADLSAGRLIMLLQKYSPPSEPLYVYYPSRAQMPGKLRAFIDFIRAANADVPSLGRSRAKRSAPFSQQAERD